MKIFFATFIVILFCNQFAIGASESSVEGDGRFYSSRDDSYEFIKEQLLFSAIKDIYTIELKNMGLDAAQFWKKFEEKFEQYYEPVQVKIKTDFEENQKTAPKSELQQKLRHKRLDLYAKFGRLDRALIGYSEKRRGRSPQDPNARFIRIAAKVDRKVLNSIYYRFLRDDEQRRFENLYLQVDYDLSGVTWDEMGVANPTDFTVVVEEHWKKWLTERMNGIVTTIEVPSVQVREKLKNYSKLSSAAKTGVDSIGINSDPSQTGLWLKVQINIKKEEEDAVAQERKFSISESFILQDLQTSKIVQYYDFPSEVHVLPTTDNHQLSSNLASAVYRLPLVEWNVTPKLIVNIPNWNNTAIIEVKKYKNILELYQFIDFLQTKLAGFRADTKLLSYNSTNASIQIYYSGDSTKFSAELMSIDNGNIGDELQAMIEDKNNPFQFFLLSKNNAIKASGKKEQQGDNSEVP